MEYKIEPIGAQFSDKALPALANRFFQLTLPTGSSSIPCFTYLNRVAWELALRAIRT